MRIRRRQPLAVVLATVPSAVLAALPSVNFDVMGKVGLSGSFAGLDLLTGDASAPAQPPLDPTTATLFSRAKDGALSRIGSTNAGGSIVAGCTLGDTFFLAGSFESIQGTSAKNIAAYSPSAGVFAPLGGSGAGLDGPADALFCDTKANQLWVGGAFKAPTSGSTSGTPIGGVVIWSPASSSWTTPPFGGLAGPVLSISQNPSSSSLLFTGSFVASFEGSGSQVALNGTSNPAVPTSSGATTFSSSLVPVPLSSASFNGTGPNSTDPRFSDITSVLCPSGADGPGNTWLAGDHAGAQITAQVFKFLSASGIRLGNTFLDNRGTKSFCATTLPDGKPASLTYVDPQTGKKQTCSDVCPLSTDSNVPYQDFLFEDGARDITGIQITLRAFKGDGPGLHLLQLLSDGAFASAVQDENVKSCFAPGASSVKVAGKWQKQNVPTDIAGTTQEVETQNVAVGTPSANAPSVEWDAYVSASGNYDVFLLVPGCLNMQDCGARTTVKVVVSPGGGLPDHVETVSQRVDKDTRQKIYSGPLIPSDPNFTVKVNLTLADDPAGKGQGGNFHLVADRVQFVLTSDVTGGTGSNGTVSLPGKSQQSYGVFEWPLSASSASATPDAQGLLPNTSITALDGAGFNLTAALGSNTATAAIRASAQHSSGKLFLAGNFTLSTGPANIVAFDGSNLAALANNGLNGGVSSLVIVDDTLFVGGTFTDTTSASGNGQFNNVVAYDVTNNRWLPLASGVNGAVSSMAYSSDEKKLYVTGSFTRLSANGTPVGGFAVWDIHKSAWVPSGGFLVGSMTLVVDDTSFVAGNALRSAQFGADGLVMLSTGKNGAPVLTPLGVALEDVTPAQPAATRKRSWFPAILPTLFARQANTAQTPLPAIPAAPAPAVLAGAFWTNVSTSVELAVLGGNFSFVAPGGGSAGAVALYDADAGTLTPLAGPAIDGTVLSLLVVDDLLFVGGEFTQEGTQANGFAIYDLAAQSWQTAVQALQPNSGSSVVVRSLTSVPSIKEKVVVAGSFASAGSLPCQGICAWNTQDKRWETLGTGVKGEVSSVVYAGENRDTMLVGGSIVLADNTASNVASYSVPNATWTAVGSGQGIPGPVTALETNNANTSSIFAAGKATDGSASFLVHYDGSSWKPISSTFTADSVVAQLAMVPLTDTHASNDVIQEDRMLWIAGAMTSSSFGNASSVLFDGANYYPYMSTTSADGGAGYVSSLFHSFATFSFTQRKFLATGIVILISIAISAGIVFLLALIGILWTLFARRDDNSNLGYPVEDDDDSSVHRPSSLLAHINEATRKTILGGDDDPFSGVDKAAMAAAAGAHHATSDEDYYQDDDGYRRAETPAVAGGVVEDTNRPAHARYSFEGTGAGELPVSAGTQLIVLDDRDPAWWYVRDVNTGQEGVVPAAYIF